jgi:hypothetical protein
MAEATFILRAVDATKQAFASVQNNLSSIDKTTKSVARGIKGFLGIGVVVAGLGKIASTMREVEAKGKEFGLSAKEIDNISAATSKLDGFMMGLKATVALTFSSLINLFSAARTEADEFNMRFAKGAPLIDASAKRVNELREQFDNLGKSEGALFNETEGKISDLVREAGAIFQSDPVESQNKREQAVVLQIENRRRQIAMEKEYQKVSQQLGGVQQSMRDELSIAEQISDARDRQATALIQLSKEYNIDARTMQIEKYSAATLELNGLLKEQARVAMQAGEMIAFGFEDAIFSGEKLSTVLKQLGLDLVRLVFQNVVTAPLAKGLGGFISNILFRADGGPVSSGSPYIVGERGPELFVPGSSGSIVPNDAMRSGGGGGGPSVNITYNIAAGVTRSELGPILESERKRLKAEIPDMVRRGGAYRAAFA